jgi:hypothetical protein
MGLQKAARGFAVAGLQQFRQLGRLRVAQARRQSHDLGLLRQLTHPFDRRRLQMRENLLGLAEAIEGARKIALRGVVV